MAQGKQSVQAKAADVVSSRELRKHVGTVHIGGNLGLLDRKLVNVLMANAYDHLLEKQIHSIPVGIMSEMLGFDSKNTPALKKALRKIVTTPVEFDLLHADGDKDWGVTTMLSAANIRGGVCTYEYSRELAGRLANPDIYLLININMQKQFNGSYALALYENCLRFKRTGSTGWIPVETWRKLLNAEASTYDVFKHFNGEVIKKAVNEVNTVSNIVIEPEYERQNRRVTKIRFKVQENPQRSMYDGSGAEEQESIRSSDTYKKLRDLGIADRLAISWIEEDAEKARRVVAYVLDKQQNNKIRGKAGGYARTVFERGGDIEEVEDVDAKSGDSEQLVLAPEQQDAAEARSKAISAAIQAMSADELHSFVLAFAEDGGAISSYSEGRFRSIVEKTAFYTWLRARVGESVVC